MGREATRCFLFQTILTTTCVCVIRSQCLSYPILGLLVSPRSQQQLHSCGVTEARGTHERLTIEGEREAHTIVAKRKERKDWRKLLRNERVDEEVANTWVCVWGSRAHVEVLAQEQKSQKGQKLKLEFQGVPELRSISWRHFTAETWPLWFRDKSQNSNPTRFRQRVRIVHYQRKYFSNILSFFTTNDCTLSSSFDPHNSFESKKKVPHVKKKKEIHNSLRIWPPLMGSLTTENKKK